MRLIIAILLLAASSFGATVPTNSASLGNYPTAVFNPTNYTLGVTRTGSVFATKLFSMPNASTTVTGLMSSVDYSRLFLVTSNAFTTNAFPLISYVSNVAQFTNAINSFNTLSIDGAKRTILLAPGTYALAVGTYRLHVSNNICIKASGITQTTITGLGSAENPMVWLFDNCLLEDCTLQSSGNGANPQLGASLRTGNPSSTNVFVSRVRFIGDDDNLWLSSETTLYQAGVDDQTIRWTLRDCEFQNHFDSVFVTSSALLGPPLVARLFNCRFHSQGPSDNATSRARGDVSNLRLLGPAALVEIFGGSFYSAGGTNVNTMAFLSGLHGADSAEFGGGLYLNNCQVQINGTNLATGGVGACLIQSTNSWVFLNGVQSNSNNIYGNGTNYWLQARSLASGVTTVGTAADTLEKDLLSYTAPGNTIGATGQAMELLAWGSYGATANTKALRVKIGGVSMLDSEGRAINGGDWFLRSTVTRVSPTAMRASALFEAPGFTTNDYTALTLTATTNIVWRITGSNHTAAANDLVLEGYKINHLP